MSFAWYDDNGNKGFYDLKKLTDYAETQLLTELYKIAKDHDIIVAWNGANFDYKVLRFRAQALNFSLWNRFEHEILHSDLLQCTKRNSPSGEFQSYALDNVG